MLMIGLFGLEAIARALVDEGNHLSPDNTNICGQLSICGAAEYVTGKDFAEAVFKALPANGGMHSLEELRKTVQGIGLHSAAIQWPRGRMPLLRSPAIAGIEDKRDRGHFIVLLCSADDYVQVLDLPWRSSWIHIEKLWEKWDGVALHVASPPAQLPAPVQGALGRAVSLVSIGLGSLVLTLLIIPNLKRRTSLSHGKLFWAVGSAVVAASVLSIVLTQAGLNAETSSVRGRTPMRIEPSSGRIEVAANREDDPKYFVTAHFRIINPANERLTIEEVASSCTCSSPTLNHSIIAPHGEADLSVKVYPSRSRSKSFTLRLLVNRASRSLFEIPCTIVAKR